jgi:hypothetical protein
MNGVRPVRSGGGERGCSLADVLDCHLRVGQEGQHVNSSNSSRAQVSARAPPINGDGPRQFLQRFTSLH